MKINWGGMLAVVATLVVLLFATSCQNPFSRPLPDTVDLSLEIVLGPSSARSLSAPADFAGKRLTVRLHATDGSDQPGTVLSSFSTVLQEPPSTGTTITVPVTFNAVPTRMDLLLSGSLIDTDTANTVYYTAQSGRFQASWTIATEVDLPFAKVTFPDTTKTITSFGFRKSLNAGPGPGLDQDYTATINGTTVSLELAEGTDPAILTNLVPTFAHTGKIVAVGGTSQISSVTKQDFSNPTGLVYAVVPVIGSPQEYTVSITISGYVPPDTISFLPNSGTGSMADQPVSNGELVTLAANTFSREGYTFEGWNTEQDGVAGQAYSDVAEFTVGAASLVLYAQWTPISYSIIFDANGGAGTTDPQAVSYDQTVTLTNNGFSRVGFRFDGWSLSAGGSVDYYDGAGYTHILAVDRTLYAIWVELGALTVTVTVVNPATVDVSLSGPAVLSQSGRYDALLDLTLPASMTVNATADLGTYHWLLDNVTIHAAMEVNPGSLGPHFVAVDSTQLGYGVHSLTLILIDGDDVPYSHQFSFAVEE